MSTDADKETACPSANENEIVDVLGDLDRCDDEVCEKKRKKAQRKVSFPEADQLVTQSFQPANPWQNVPPTTRAQLTAEYLEACRRHDTTPIASVLEQIRELPEESIGGAVRAPRLTLCSCTLIGCAPVDALEAVLRKTRFRRLEIDHAEIDDEGAEALFDMIEYYESAAVVSISGPRAFGIRGWQAASRMIKKSASLSELEVWSLALTARHAPVLARALRPLACGLRALALQGAALAGEPLHCLVIALKSNISVRELRLGDNQLTAFDAAQLAALLRHNARVQLLDLSNNEIQDAGVAHLADALADQAPHSARSSPASPATPATSPISGCEASGLAFLVLWNNQLTRNCAPHLAKALRSSQSLCVLNIGRNAIGTDTVRALTHGGSLISLGLQAARLGPEAARAIAELVKDTKLQRLDLRDNKLGAAGLEEILAALKLNKSLTQIDLDDATTDNTSLSTDPEQSRISRCAAEIASHCRRNQTSSPGAPRRRISLTCHTPGQQQPVSSAPRHKSRLRSPAPSPAPSPVPPPTGRFCVTPVSSDRDSSCDSASPSTPPRTGLASRFTVNKVAEPPQNQVSETPKRTSSRFSVSRNYDSSYHSPLATPSPTTPSPTTKKHRFTVEPNITIKRDPSDDEAISDAKNLVPDNKVVDSSDLKLSDEPKTVKMYSDAVKSDVYKDKCEQMSHNEVLSVIGSDKVVKTETKLVKCSVEESASEKQDVQVEVTVKKESTESNDDAKVHSDQNVSEHIDFKNIDVINASIEKNGTAIKKIEALTEDISNIIAGMKELSTKTTDLIRKDSNVKLINDCSQTDIDLDSKLDTFNDVPVSLIRDNVVLKKNKSESSLDSPDLEVSRLMNKKLVGSPFCDSSSSLEISGSSMESLNAIDNQHVNKPIIVQESNESDTELDRRKPDLITLSTESSMESNTSEPTPVNCPNFLNMSVSSNESVSPIIFGKNKKIHGSLSSLEASVSSIDSARQEKAMVTSADSGIEYSLQNAIEIKDDTSANDGTLTNNSSLKETVKKDVLMQDTLTSSPKRTASLLDVPAMKSKGMDRIRKISWVAPSPSFHIPKPEPEKIDMKLPSHLDKLLSLFQHPTTFFRSTSSDDEKKSNTPPRKDSSLTSSFWTWGSSTDKESKEEKEDRDSPSEATDSTLSERVQVSFVDESFSKKLDSKTPSTDTDNTLSEYQSFPQGNSETSDVSQEEKVDRVTEVTTDENLVQKCIGLSVKTVDSASSNDNASRACDIIDLIKPNDLNKNVCEITHGDTNKNPECNAASVTDAKCEKIDVKHLDVKLDENKPAEAVRPRSFAAVLKSSGSENSLDKPSSPETGQPVDKLPSKVIRGIKENISPENTLTSSMSNTKALACELSERQVKTAPIVNTVWELTAPLIKTDDVIHDLAPIATIEETNDETADNIQLDYIDDDKPFDDRNTSVDSGVTSLGGNDDIIKKFDTKTSEERVDLGKDALSYLIYENQDFEPDTEQAIEDSKTEHGSLAQELKEAEIKEQMLDLSPELIIDEAVEVPEMFLPKDLKIRTSPVIPDRAKIVKANSLEDLSKIQVPETEKDSPKTKMIVFKVPEISTPRDIPDRRPRLRTRSGSSPKSLPECLSKHGHITKMESILCKKKKRVSSLGKIAKDSLLALNMSEEDIQEHRRSYKLRSVESLRSLESVSEDANSQSGNSVDSRCRACLRLSQESLMSLDSINEDCKCVDESDKS